jgi:thymidylate synthase (FAD)
MNTARIIAVTQPIRTEEFSLEPNMTAEDLIAYCARVSNPQNQMTLETAPKLLKYLIKNKHWSPFEMAHIVMEIHTTRDIARQILRHRSFSFQEFSQRYADPTKDLGFTTREARLQDTKNRQNSIENDDKELENEWRDRQDVIQETVQKHYEWAIRNGIAKEQARAVLPEGLTVSTMYMAGSLRSFIHWIEVRTDPSTQKEHREVAFSAWNEIAKYFPSIVSAIVGE